MLKSLLVQNLRSFHEEFEFEIKPITILLGRNSSGKSSITRLIPLYRQSFEQRTSAPILWNGNLVDFGSVADVRPRNHESVDIGLGFELSIDSQDDWWFRRRYIFPRQPRIDFSEPIKYKVGLTDVGDDDADYRRTRLCRVELTTNGDSLKLSLDEEGGINSCTINGLSFKDDVAKNETRFDVQSFFPAMRSKMQRVVTSSSSAAFDYLDEEKLKIISPMCHGSTNEDTRKDIAHHIPYTSRGRFPDFLRKSGIGTEFFRNKVKEYQGFGVQDVERLRLLALLSALPQIISVVGEIASAEFLLSSYIGPMRAAGERYYRWQELAVDRLDPKGENFAMYMMSLSPPEQIRFSELLSKHFGYTILAKRESGHASLMLSDVGSSEYFNIADVGFGFSQILPVIAQIHAAQRRPAWQRARLAPNTIPISSSIFAVEQPELHLHPAFQGKIADLLCASTGMAGSKVEVPSREPPPIERNRRFIVETHSEALVNRFGELVATGQLKETDIVIYIFEKGDASSETRVRRADFNAGGELKNWPYGFFNY